MFERDQAFRAAVARGMTTAEATRARYRETSLDSPEGSYRAPVMSSEAEPPTDEEQLTALLQRSETGWAPAR
jgi:hypothetical protein